MVNNESDKEKDRKLRIAYEALEECNELHDTTGRERIPLDEVAENLAISKEQIQDSFDLLVELGVIGDDGDRDHLNYQEGGELLELIKQLLEELERTSKQKKEKSREKEEAVIYYID
ncbi:MAG: hypothetical protein EU536_01640 [Promethearchaeota archaeon]|nr:MAG: hypothetical protein EU536_01640 [Candidatus Lokiarchaeota archaeon]